MPTWEYVDAENALITIIATIIVATVVVVLTALMLILCGWSFCYLTGKHCTLTNMLLHGIAIFSITLIIGLVLHAILECGNQER